MSIWRTLTLVTAGLCLGTWMAQEGKAVASAKDLQVGAKAPSFQAVDDQGKEWKSSDHVGQKILVVYFYPAALTGGCTKQACGFRDEMEKLSGQGVEVVGVSGDEVRNLQIFKQTHHLNFTLLSDPEGAVAKKFGVPVHAGGEFKTQDPAGLDVVLKRGVTESRWTFVIGKDRDLLFKNTQVNAPEDARQVLKVVEQAKNK
ncbi:MAG: peroxiredoxin [Planctomycetes bacterium]|nr:peroxiredoxin [Planctomycetota bacterium]